MRQSLSVLLAKRHSIWRYPSTYEDPYGVCDPISLNSGVILSTSPNLIISPINAEGQYEPLCYQNQIHMSVFNDALSIAGVEKLPILKEAWQDYMDNGYEFIYTAYPIIYSLSCCLFICLFAAIIIFTKQYLKSQKPPKLIKLSTLASALYLMGVYIFAIVSLYKQHKRCIVNGELLINNIQDLLAFDVIELFIVILLQLSQVQIIMRLFPTQKEKRFAFLIGIFLSFSSQAIWSVSNFSSATTKLDTDPEYDSNVAILPAFVYLLRIAMSIMFSSLFVVYFFNKRQFIFAKKIAPLTFFTFFIINSSVAIFIADVSNIWVSELSELFNITSYVLSNVSTWEFINRVILLEKSEQKKGILGRQFYNEDDHYFLDSYGTPLPKSNLLRKGKYDFIISSHDRDQENAVEDGFIVNHLAGSSMWNKFISRFNSITDRLIDMLLSAQIRHGTESSSASLYDAADVPRPSFLSNIVANLAHKNIKPSNNNEATSFMPLQAESAPKVFVYQQQELKATKPASSAMHRRMGSSVHHYAQVELQAPKETAASPNRTRLSSHSRPESSHSILEEIIYDEGSYDFDDDYDDVDDNSISHSY